jgi:serine protease Do
MHRLVHLTALAALLVLPAARAADDKPASAELKALQAAVEKAAAAAEPSVGTVLVSRSKHYEQFDPPAGDDPSPGALGRFDAAAALAKAGDDKARRKLIESLDLSRADSIPEGYGSGIVLDESGLVLTAASTVRNARKVYVRFGDRGGSWADIHASDYRSDLAVLRLLDKVAGLKAIPMGDGAKVKKGQFLLLAAGKPAPGFRDTGPSVTWGLVANLRRPLPGTLARQLRNSYLLHQYPLLWQIDTRQAPVSGAAVLNLDGELVGLVTARAAVEGGDSPGVFALPLDSGLQRIVEVLRRGEEVEYGFLGVSLSERDKAPDGVVLASIEKGSPAKRAGLRDFDILLSVDGVPVRHNDDVFLLVGMRLAGSTVKVEVKTPDEMPRTCTVTLAKYYVDGPTIASKRPALRRGLRVDYSSVLKGRTSVPPWLTGVPEGVLIREVQPKSPADRAQLQVDKIITKVNGTKVLTPAEFYREMDRAAGKVELSLLTETGGEETVTLDAK